MTNGAKHLFLLLIKARFAGRKNKAFFGTPQKNQLYEKTKGAVRIIINNEKDPRLRAPGK